MRKVKKEFAVIEWNGKNTELLIGTLGNPKYFQERRIDGTLTINYRDRETVISKYDTIWLDEKGDLYVNLFKE